MMIDRIDHIVYAVPDLISGIQQIESSLNVKVFKGGKHLNHGTQNAILKVGNNCYLEIISKDLSNPLFPGDRWMGVDMIGKEPCITRWAIQADINQQNLDILKAYDPALSQKITGSRVKSDGRLLQWSMSEPQPDPKVECCPFLIDWSDSDHPCNHLPMECRLIELKLFTPDTQKLKSVISSLEIDIPVIQSTESRIAVTLDTPGGIIILS